MVDKRDPADRFDDVDGELPLPGLVADAPQDASELEHAARRTLRALSDAKLLDESHALDMQLLLDLCRGYSRSVLASRGKVSVAASHTAGQIMDLLDRLPKPDAVPTAGDAFDTLAGELREAADAAMREVLDAAERGKR